MNTESVRQAIHAVLKENPTHLKAEAIARRMGVHPSTLYRWGEPGQDTIPLDRLVQLTLITGDIRAMQALAHEVGGIFTPRKTAHGIVSGEVASVRAIKEFGDLLQTNGAALLDGRVTVKENARIQKEGADALMAIAELMELAAQSAGAPRA